VAVRSAILATAWLLVKIFTVRSTYVCAKVLLCQGMVCRLSVRNVSEHTHYLKVSSEVNRVMLVLFGDPNIIPKIQKVACQILG